MNQLFKKKLCRAVSLGCALPLLAGTSSDISPSTVYDLSPTYLAVGVSVAPVGNTNAVQIAADNSGDGGASIKLGGIGLLGDGQMAGIEWTATGSGILAFDWKVSSESDYDWLRFYELGRGTTNKIAGNIDWTHISVTVNGAVDLAHTFRWEYEKDPIGDYVGSDCGWIDTISWSPFYTLTVNAGTGSGAYTNGSVVSLAAASPPEYFTFDHWTGDTNTIANVIATSTTIRMPSGNATVTATYKSILYTLSVGNGSGDGTYTNGASVPIVADDPPAHFIFDRWAGNTNGIGDVLSPSTVLVMIGSETAVTATYKPIFYPLTVNNGTGGGVYTNSTVVLINADLPPIDQKFDRWIGDTNSVDNVLTSSTVLIMSSSAVTVTATYVSMLHSLNVVNGSGSGVRLEGSIVNVSADPDPLWKEFAAWTGDASELLTDVAARTTLLTMPTRPATLIATYRDSIARITGSFGRTYSASGTLGAITPDGGAGSLSGTPAVKLGGAGVIPDNGFAAFETVVSGTGWVFFQWKVSSESNGDYLKFKVDGVEIAAISGTKGPWTLVSNRVETAGSHTLRWEYVKNASVSSSTDAGWVDDIIWIGDTPEPVITPDIHTANFDTNLLTLSFLGERGIPYTIYTNASLNSIWWVPSAIEPQEAGETNGLFRYEAVITPTPGQPACFYRVKGGLRESYLVIDLSGGTNAVSYPVSYLDAVPVGGWTDEYKTTKLVLRKISKGTFTMGSPEDELGRNLTNEVQHTVTLTKDFYIGVFEVTQRQWELVIGNKPSYFNNAEYYSTRPVETISYYMIRENPANSDDPAVDWPNNSAVNTSSFMGRLRAKTGISAFDLPTESQWEYACRAGTTTALNTGYNLTSTSNDPRMDEVGRYWCNGSEIYAGYDPSVSTLGGTAKAGSYLPNAWGLYDMHGNVLELCLDWWDTNPATVTDPVGSATGSFRVARSGSMDFYAYICRSAYRYYYLPNRRYESIGFRAAMTLP